MRKNLSFILVINFSILLSQNQSNMYFSGEMNSWSATSMTFNDLGTDTWVVTIQSDGDDGSSEFLFRDNNSNYDNKWARGASATLGSKTTWYAGGGNSNINETNSKYYTFLTKDVGDGANSEGYVFEFSQNPISISSVSNVGNGLASTAYTVTVGLSGTPDTDERVYVRYTADNWSSSSVVEGDPSSNSIDIDIPGQSAAASVQYYVFTSVTGISNSDADLATISFDNNSGSNYSYYVESGSLTISGSAGFRILSTPVSNGTYTDLLAELWTQGMTGSDAAEASADNVWDFTLGSNAAGTWNVVSNLGSTMDAGEGFLVYVYSDNDYDGNDDLPKTLSVSGSENTSDVRYPALGSIDASQYGLTGNPYYSTIDFDDIARTNVEATCYVYDNAKSGGAGYISWNGSSGDLTNGLIAPFQGFWVQATSSGSAYITIQEADKATSSGTFYRTSEDHQKGSMYLEVSTLDGGYDKVWLSYRVDGETSLDGRDAHRLMPLMASSKLVGMTYVGDQSLNINNIPFDHEGTIHVPLDVMSLSLEEGNYVTTADEVTMNWDLEQMPDHISVLLIDNLDGTMISLDQEMEHTFTTQSKGSFSATYEEALSSYPLVGEPRFSLQITYNALISKPQKIVPIDFVLEPVYPNPFNPSARIRFDIPEVSRVELSVFDITGGLVETLLNGKMTPGSHEYTWQPQGLSTGVYFLRLTTANEIFTQKVTYVR